MCSSVAKMLARGESYAGCGIIVDEKKIHELFACSPDAVGEKIVRDYAQKYGDLCELYVIEIKDNEYTSMAQSRSHKNPYDIPYYDSTRSRYFIGRLVQLKDEVCVIGREAIDELYDGRLAALGLHRDAQEILAFGKYSYACEIIFHHEGKSVHTLIQELYAIGEEYDTMSLKEIGQKTAVPSGSAVGDDAKSDNKSHIYKLAYKCNCNGECYIYKFSTDEPIEYMHEGVVSGGSETVICMLTQSYVYTAACGKFLRMKISDISAIDLPDIRRDGTKDSHITFAFQMYMESLQRENSPLVEVVAVPLDC